MCWFFVCFFKGRFNFDFQLWGYSLSRQGAVAIETVHTSSTSKKQREEYLTFFNISFFLLCLGFCFLFVRFVFGDRVLLRSQAGLSPVQTLLLLLP